MKTSLVAALALSACADGSLPPKTASDPSNPVAVETPWTATAPAVSAVAVPAPDAGPPTHHHHAGGSGDAP